MTEREATEFVQSFARGLAVIRAFDGEQPEMTLSDVARRAGIPRAAARRFLHTLEALGYVVVVPEGRFRLTPRVLDLGYGYLSGLALPEIVQPHLDVLSHRIGESVSVAVLDGTDIVYVARAEARRIMRVRITIGTRLPAPVTSMGRVLLAALPEQDLAERLAAADTVAYTERTLVDHAQVRAEIARVRAQGWAMVDGELEDGLRSIAVPLHGRSGTVAALNVSTSTARGDAQGVAADLLPMLQHAAQAIDLELRASAV